MIVVGAGDAAAHRADIASHRGARAKRMLPAWDAIAAGNAAAAGRAINALLRQARDRATRDGQVFRPDVACAPEACALVGLAWRRGLDVSPSPKWRDLLISIDG